MRWKTKSYEMMWWGLVTAVWNKVACNSRTNDHLLDSQTMTRSNMIKIGVRKVHSQVSASMPINNMLLSIINTNGWTQYKLKWNKTIKVGLS